MTLGKRTRKLKLIVKLMILSAFILIVYILPAQAAPHLQTIDCATQLFIPTAECDALVALYTSTSGAGWTDSTDWTTPVDPCTWFGVTCTGINVTALNLPTNNLDGSLPTEIGDLTAILTLDLSDNLLTSSIPVEIGTLILVETLNLSNNTLTGSVPSQIGNLIALLNLDVSTNIGLTGPLPDTMINLVVLTDLDYSNTDLCEPQHSAFQIWMVGITIVPSGLICEIDCSKTAETAVPQTQCEALFALYNNTAGASWTLSTDWIYTYSVCSWYGVTCGGGNVTEIVLNNNNLAGPLPGRIGDYPYLTNLNLLRNGLTGTIPGQIQSLVRLSILNLGRNNLNGVLPNSMGNMSLLTSMDLRRNAFTGQVPVSFANLTNLNFINTTQSTLCLPAALTTWYAGLTHIDTIPPCVVPPTSTNTPVPTATGSGSSVDPTGTPLPSNTPTITFTPTITPTPTLVFPLQTLTKMAQEATILSTRDTGFRTATTAATATLYYTNPQQKTETQVAIDATTESEPTESGVEGGSEQGGSQSGGSSVGGLFGILSKYVLWGVVALVFIGGGIGLFILMRRRKDDDSPTASKKESEFETFT